MCLAVPAKVIQISDHDMAIIELEGVKKNISIALLEEVSVGDYVIVHVGYALTKLSPEEAEKTLKLMSEIGIL